MPGGGGYLGREEKHTRNKHLAWPVLFSSNEKQILCSNTKLTFKLWQHFQVKSSELVLNKSRLSIVHCIIHLFNIILGIVGMAVTMCTLIFFPYILTWLCRYYTATCIHTDTHTHIYTHIYVYIRVCLCVTLFWQTYTRG